MNNVDVESVPTNSISVDEIDKLLNKYFETLEVQKKRETDLKTQELEQNSVNETQYNTTIEYNEQLLLKLEEINKNTQFSNNVVYAFGILSFAIVGTVVFYKFLKLFI